MMDAVEWNERGRQLLQRGMIVEARSCFARAASVPGARGAAINVGQCDLRLGRHRDAERSALALLQEDAGFTPAWHLLSTALERSGQPTQALQAITKAIALDPLDPGTLRSLGNLQRRCGRVEEARDTYARVLAQYPGDGAALAALVGIKRTLCDWDGLDVLVRRLKQSVVAGAGFVRPFDFLREPASAEEQKSCAVAWSAQYLSEKEGMDDHGPWKGARRIGFVSAGFGSHATSLVIVGLVEILSRMGVDLRLYSLRPDDGSALWCRLAAAVPLQDLSGMDWDEKAAVLRTAEIDVLFDLDGHAVDDTLEVFARRPSAVQVSWLYAGATGTSFIDYMMLDAFTVPVSSDLHFSEKIVRLPRCFFPGDPWRPVSPPLSREAYGLPPEGPVYACFNNPQKLDPGVFARMMAVLRAVPDGTLWLPSGEGSARERLRSAATAHGVAPARLVFLPSSAHADYQAAYGLADLFLDTDHYNAHTTAWDALWAGCPILTLPGETLAARVAGSMNHHAGLTELNAPDASAYVERAIRVGKDVAYRRDIRQRLAEARLRSSLFDMQGFARDFLSLVETLTPRPRVG